MAATTTWEREPRSPTLDEMVLGVQLEGPRFDDGLMLAQFWPTIREAFPKIERQPGLPPLGEEFSDAPPTAQFYFGEPPARYWFVSEDDSRLVQIQPDRLLLNWRRRPDGAEYPGYDQMRTTFLETYDRLLSVYGQAAPVVDWTEVTYINHLNADDGAGGHVPLHSLASFAAPLPDVLPPPEDTQVQQRHRLLDGDEPVGRLHLSAVSARHVVDAAPIYALTLVVRRRPQPHDVEGVRSAFDVAHDLIGAAFQAVVADDVEGPPR